MKSSFSLINLTLICITKRKRRISRFERVYSNKFVHFVCFYFVLFSHMHIFFFLFESVHCFRHLNLLKNIWSVEPKMIKKKTKETRLYKYCLVILYTLFEYVFIDRNQITRYRLKSRWYSQVHQNKNRKNDK